MLLQVAPATDHGGRSDEFDQAEFRAAWRTHSDRAHAYETVVVDADRPEDAVAADVARAVWERLP